MTLTVGSLFSGIGGMDLGLERAGHTVIWQSEIDPYCNKVLKKHWPTVPNLGDITTIDWGKIERPDIICGGYPCQPFSTAGKRNGTADPRHLWPAMHNAICELRPRYALMENVRGHLSMGFGDVLADLAEIGYDAEWQVIPAAAELTATGRRKSKNGKTSHSLGLADAVQMWPTPMATDWKPRGPNSKQKGLAEAVKMWPTPTARDYKGASGRSIKQQKAQDLPYAVGGKLNPTWVEWLMGFPIGWTDLED
jgi:hypothetical protein